MIELGKKYQTRDGRAVRILCTDLKGCGCATVIGLVTQQSGTEYVESWMADGRMLPGGGDKNSDLIPVPTKHEGWMVVTQKPAPHGDCVYADRVNAEIACGYFLGEHIVHITWED